jgi:hypothetical protein
MFSPLFSQSLTRAARSPSGHALRQHASSVWKGRMDCSSSSPYFVFPYVLYGMPVFGPYICFVCTYVQIPPLYSRTTIIPATSDPSTLPWVHRQWRHSTQAPVYCPDRAFPPCPRTLRPHGISPYLHPISILRFYDISRHSHWLSASPVCDWELKASPAHGAKWVVNIHKWLVSVIDWPRNLIYATGLYIESEFEWS